MTDLDGIKPLPEILNEEIVVPVKPVTRPLPQLPALKNEVESKQFFFDGKWMPDYDGSEIGADNFTELQNLKYTDDSPVGVSGYFTIAEFPQEPCDCSSIEWDYDNSAETIAADSNVLVFATAVGATGTCAPFSWSVSGDGYSLAYAETPTPVNILYADSDPACYPSITVETCDGKTATGYLRGPGCSFIAVYGGTIGSGICYWDPTWYIYYNTPICRFSFQLMITETCGGSYQGCWFTDSTPCSGKCPLDDDGNAVVFPNGGAGSIHSLSLSYWR